MKIAFNNQNDKAYQKMLNKLLRGIFLDFQFWYDLNMWDENYESYSIIEKGEIVSNICVFKTQVLLNRRKYSALSIGAVATKKEFRGRGLSRLLMEHIIQKYDGTPMFLSANDAVVNFYPKFGFERIFEKLPVYYVGINNDIRPMKLEYDDPKVWDYIYNRVNFSQKLDCLNTASINIFHIHCGYLKNYIYELPEIETLLIAKQNETTLKLMGVFSLKSITFHELMDFLPFSNVHKIEFGFMPYWSDINFAMQEYESDPFFVRGLTCRLGDIKFPELSIT